MDRWSEAGAIADGAGALPGARRRCEAGKRTHGPGQRACLALLAAAALLALAAPAQAQTEVWSATLTPQDAGNGALGCDSTESNTAATGAPTITGTAQVGQTLTAVTTGIVDANGLTSPGYTYQWIRVNGTEADIAGENSSTYTLVDADRRRTNEKDDFRVRGRHHADGGIRPGAGRRLVGHFHTRRCQWIRGRLPKWRR